MKHPILKTVTMAASLTLLAGCSNSMQLSILHGIQHFNNYLVKAHHVEDTLPSLIATGGTPSVPSAEKNWPVQNFKAMVQEYTQDHMGGKICAAQWQASMLHLDWLNVRNPLTNKHVTPKWSWQTYVTNDLLLARKWGYEAGGWNAKGKPGLCFARAENQIAQELYAHTSDHAAAAKILTECEQSPYWGACEHTAQAHHILQNSPIMQKREEAQKKEMQHVLSTANQTVPGL